MCGLKSIVLEVKEGRGFQNFHGDVILQAELNGVSFKTKRTRSTRKGNVHFNKAFIWEMQNKFLRRIKTSSTSLKIECYSFLKYNNNIRIGFLVLKLKSIKESHPGEDVEGKWMELLGFNAEARQKPPSVFLKFYYQESFTRNPSRKPRSDALLFKLLKELYHKKIIQKEMLTDQMKMKEMQHMDLLSSEWHLKCDFWESKLTKIISKNKALMISLKNAITDIQEMKYKTQDDEKQLKLMKGDLKKEYNLKLQNIQAAPERVEDGSKNKTDLLREQIDKLQKENVTLNEKAIQQEEEISGFIKESIPKDQLVTLISEVQSLQENLDASIKSKEFFRNQLSQALRELHLLKLDIGESLREKINQNKEELEEFSLLLKTANIDSTSINEEQVIKYEYSPEYIDEQNMLGEYNYFFGNAMFNIQRPHTHCLASSFTATEDELSGMLQEGNALHRLDNHTSEDNILYESNPIRSYKNYIGNET